MTGAAKRRSFIQRIALALIITPLTLFVVFVVLGVIEPRLIVENWDLYTILFALPWAAALGLLIFQRKVC